MRSCNRPQRRGITLTEAAVSVALLAALVPTVAKLSATLAARERAAERRVAATHALEAALEQVVAQGWEGTAPGRIEPPELPAAFAPHVLHARMTAESEEDDVGRRVTIGVTWRDPNGRRAGPLRLSAWVIPHEEAAP